MGENKFIKVLEGKSEGKQQSQDLEVHGTTTLNYGEM
jgi:hypothetical protein